MQSTRPKSKNATETPVEALGRVTPIALIMLLLVAAAGPAARAHSDPPGAEFPDPSQFLTVFSDSACTSPLAVIVGGAGQTVYLQATLMFTPATGAASFELGRWRMTAAGLSFSGSDPLVAPVPCIGDPVNSTNDTTTHVPARGMCAGAASTLLSPCIPYTVTAADATAGFVVFQAILGDSDTSSPDTSYAHTGPSDQAGVSSMALQQVDIKVLCGNGTLDPGETCDPADPTAPANCRPAGDPEECTYCGDGTEQASEECDDGNNDAGDGCSATCTDEPFCGDGTVDPGETCDPNDPGAPANCRPVGDAEECTYCGDGTEQASEECDDGNNDAGDGCDAACVIEVEKCCNVQSATGTGMIQVCIIAGGGPGCTLTDCWPVDPATLTPPSPNSEVFPHGLVGSVAASCERGSTVDFQATYPDALPAGTTFWKFGPTTDDPSDHWYQYPAVISLNTATYSITDGTDGDRNLMADGTIEDPAGPGVAGVPTLPQAALAALALALLLLGALALRRRWRES